VKTLSPTQHAFKHPLIHSYTLTLLPPKHYYTHTHTHHRASYDALTNHYRPSTIPTAARGAADDEVYVDPGLLELYDEALIEVWGISTELGLPSLCRMGCKGNLNGAVVARG
jgi:hypothetical protein